ncbi:MAG: NADPH:quinone reductase-like Zn-dependent oxidoreductase [Bradymonadia bacterium]|jgi:NADPH:quinone reductase-like Zn-dependent oxidoreductase
MKAIRIHGYGAVETLCYEDAPLPEPGAEDLRIRVHAAAVNPVDWKIRAGYLAEMIPHEMPLTLGWDVSGIVDQVGADVTDVSVGDAVYSRPDIARNGSYAEYMVVRASEVAAKPKTLSHNEAAAVPLAALTAWQLLFGAAALKKSERVLIHAGAGGVGSFAIQLAKWAGAHVIATASAPNEALVRDLGADEFVNYRTQKFEEVLDKVDVVFDTIGGDTQERSVQLLKSGGRLFSVVSPPDDAVLAAAGATGGFVFVQPSSEELGRIAGLIDAGTIRVMIDSVFPLSEARAAHEKSETGRAKGKIVLEVVSA